MQQFQRAPSGDPFGAAPDKRRNMMLAGFHGPIQAPPGSHPFPAR